MRKRFMVMTSLLLLVPGCMDATRATGHTPAPGSPVEALAWDGYDAPSFTSLAEVPAEYYGAEVRTTSLTIRWVGNVANAYASMTYYGNRGSQHLTVTVMKDYSEVTRNEIVDHARSTIIPSERSMGTPLPTVVPEACGQLATLKVLYAARVVAFVTSEFTQFSFDDAQRFDDAPQPDCAPDEPCSVDTYADHNYDPYAGDDCGDSGNDGGGSGTQYYPGDYTGGETVDWESGTGNGGTSACGTAARVHWLCIEILTEHDGWVEVCGYATAC